MNKKITLIPISLVSIGLSILLLGCGSESSSVEQKKNISVPNKVDVNIPKVLQGGSKKQNSPEKAEEQNEIDASSLTNNSRGYIALKNNISEAESTKQNLQVNLLLADKIMPQIQEACKDTPLGRTCEIESGELSFVLDTNMRREINQIVDLEDSDNLREHTDKRLTLGKTTFTQYDSLADYQYALFMDMTPIERNFDTDTSLYTQTIKWSKDENRVWSTHTNEDKGSKSSMSLRYTKDKEGKTEMEIDDKHEFSTGSTGIKIATSSIMVDENGTIPSGDIISLENDTPTVENRSGEFHFKISNKNENFKIISNNSDFEDKREIGSSSSVGEISDQGGYLSFRGTFLENEYREKEKFDANSKIVFSGYCDSSQACDLDDESTWLTRGDESFAIPVEAKFVELSVTGGVLKTGLHLLLAPNSSIDSLSSEDIFDQMIGEIFSSKSRATGTLNTKEYLNKLSELVIVYVNYSKEEENIFKEPSFEVVTEQNRPLLKEE